MLTVGSEFIYIGNFNETKANPRYLEDILQMS